MASFSEKYNNMMDRLVNPENLLEGGLVFILAHVPITSEAIVHHMGKTLRRCHNNYRLGITSMQVFHGVGKYVTAGLIYCASTNQHVPPLF